MSLLFAIHPTAEAVMISESLKGSNQITFLEQIARRENETFYLAVETLTSLSRSPDLDVKIFKAMDKVCQMMYEQHRGK
jgi:ribosomal protein L7Ae-like RNA K-turn-binding protein